MDGEYWYKYIKEHRPDVLGKDIIKYVENLKVDKEELQKQLLIQRVSHQRELLLAYEKSQQPKTWFMSKNEAECRIDDFLANNCG